MNIKEQKKFARNFYNHYCFVLMETEENFAELYRVCRFRLWREDETLTNDDIQSVWKLVLGEYVKDCRNNYSRDNYESRKKERVRLLQGAKKCLHKFHNEDLRSIIFENELRDIEHYELDNYWGIKQADLINGYNEDITKETLDAYCHIEENRKMISNNINKLSPIAIAKITEIIREDE